MQVSTFCSCSLGEHQFFSLTNYALLLISSFNSVMLFVEIFLIICLFFSFSTLTVFQSQFLRGSQLFFFSDTILFIITTFICLLLLMFIPLCLSV